MVDVIFSLTVVLVAIVDQLTKAWVRSYAEGSTIFTTGLFRFIHYSNPGAAFGILQGYSFALTVVTSFVVVLILIMVFFYWRRLSVFSNLLSRTGLSLYLGGAIGNLADRLRFGSVTDFIDFRFWPAFNVADASMSVGVILFAYALLMYKSVKPQNPEEE